MIRKDFEVIARVIRGLDFFGAAGEADRLMVARAFARELSYTNPRFDADKFLAACKEDP